MKKLKRKALIITIFIFILSPLLAFQVYRAEKQNFINNLNEDFVSLGLSPVQINMDTDKISVYLNSSSDNVSSEDLLLIRYIEKEVYKMKTSKPIEINLQSGSNEIIYSRIYTEKPPVADYSTIISDRTMEDLMLDFKLRFLLSENEITYTGKKIAEYPQVHLEDKKVDTGCKTVNLQIKSTEEEHREIMRKVESIIKELNRQGAAIAQYNIEIRDPDSNFLHLCSFDLALRDTLNIK